MTEAAEDVASATPEEPATQEPEAPKPRKPRAVKPPVVDGLPRKGSSRNSSGSRGKGKKRRPVKKWTADDIGRQIEGGHALIAAVRKNDAYKIRPADAKSMGQAIWNVVEEYDMWWLLAQLPIVELIVTVASVEAPYVYLAWLDFKEGRKNRGKAQDGSGGRAPEAAQPREVVTGIVQGSAFRRPQPPARGSAAQAG